MFDVYYGVIGLNPRAVFVFSDRKISKYKANIHGLTQNFLTDLTTQSSSHSELLKNQQFKRKNNF
jgi:hypothetical protein